MYDWLSLLDKNCVYTIFMVIDGENKGEKLVLSEEKVIWKSQKCEFLSQNLKEIKKTCQQGILIIEGQRIFCEQIGSPASLVICGAGYVSLAVIMIAKSIGMHVTVIEDRPKFADHARNAGADVVYCESFGKGLAGIEGGQDTYFVVVTRGHRYDKECLEAILQKPYAYLGMMGSRRRVTAMKEQLLQNGNDPNDVEKIHMPIGLSISAESPEEIAVSIMAEIIMVKNQKRKASEYSREMIRYLTGQTGGELKKVLATIVEKHGSAPRKAGTKMLILENGQTIGTIGGGCAEANVIREGMFLMDRTHKDSELMKVHMSGEEMQEMMCGGNMEVFLEKIGY